MTEELRTQGERQLLRIERELSHPIEKVWRALTESAQLSAWFPATVTMEPRVGGKVVFDQEGGLTTGSVLELVPPRVLAFDWGGDLLRFELTESATGSKLTFSHAFDVRSAAASFASGWQLCLDGLDQILLGKAVESTADMDELHEQYVAKFGLAVGTLERGDDSWEVRFDRQLTKPAEAVWQVLTAMSEAEPALGEPAPTAFTGSGEAAGEVTNVDSPKLLEYRSRTGLVRWEFQAGTGHGARLLLTHSGLTEADAKSVLANWQKRIEALAGDLATKRG